MSVSDYLLKMLEMMARALGIALFKLKDLKQKGDADGGFDFIKQNFKEELDLELEDLLNIEHDQLLEYLLSRNFKTKHFELVSEILFELSETISDKNERVNVLSKSSILINWAVNNDKTYFSERQKLINKINSDLNIINVF